jgi:heat shock protein HtpX
MAGLQAEIQSNKRRSAMVIGVFIVFVVAVCAAFNYILNGGVFGIIFAMIFAVALSFGSYWSSDKVALSMSRAQPADPQEYARLHNIVEGLAIAAGLPKPRVYIVQDDAPNAFATGRNPKNAAIAVTTGLLGKMNRVELEGVIAHEMCHIKDYDILVSTICVTFVGLIALLADWGVRMLWFGGGRDRDRDNNMGGAGAIIAIFAIVLLILSPIIAQIMQAAVSRRRESMADIEGVNLTRYPPGLISALEKLQEDQTVVTTASRATAHLWIESPLARTPDEGKFSRLNNLWDTHPPLADRIAILKNL